jgi:hypothetical protein
LIREIRVFLRPIVIPKTMKTFLRESVKPIIREADRPPSASSYCYIFLTESCRRVSLSEMSGGSSVPEPIE